MEPVYIFCQRGRDCFACFEACGPFLTTVDFDGLDEADAKALRNKATAAASRLWGGKVQWSPVGAEGEEVDLGSLTFRGKLFTVSAHKVF